MPMIKLDATDSTNEFLKNLLKETDLVDYTTIWAEYQSKGKGQRDKTWQSDKGKNLIISILKEHTGVSAHTQFHVNIAVTLGLLNTLQAFNIPDLSIKWPNDILSGRQKICGILIENSIKNNVLARSIIGIGLNVNQEVFDGLPYATSLRGVTGKEYDRDIVFYQLLEAIKRELSYTDHADIKRQKENYEALLFHKGKRIPIRINDTIKDAIVQGISDSGALELAWEDGGTGVYAHGEVQWLYE